MPLNGPQLSTDSPPEPESNGESSDDDYGPALPPNIASARAQTNTLHPEPAARARPVIGPSLPLAHEVDDDDDDDVGPSPLPASALRQQESDGVKAFLEAEERRKKGLEVNTLFIMLLVTLLISSRANLDQSLLNGKSGCWPHPLHPTC